MLIDDRPSEGRPQVSYRAMDSTEHSVKVELPTISYAADRTQASDSRHGIYTDRRQATDSSQPRILNETGNK